MADRNIRFILKNSDIVNRPYSGSTVKAGEPIVNTAEGIMLFSGITTSTNEWTPSGVGGEASFFEVGSNLYDLKLRNQLIEYQGTSGAGLVGKFLSGTTNGFVLNDVSNISGVDSFVTGGTFNNSTDTLTLDINNGQSSVNITGMADNFTTGATFIGSTAYFDRNDGLSAYTLDLSTFVTTADTYTTNFTYDGNNNLTLTRNQGQPALSVTIDTMSGLTVEGNLTVTGTTNLQGETTVDDNLIVNGNETVNGNSIVTGTTNLQGEVTLDDNIIVNGNSTVNGNSVVTGTTNLQGAVTVDDDVTINGNSTLNGNLSVTGQTSLNGVDVSGDISACTGTLFVETIDACTTADTITINANLDVNGDITGNTIDAQTIFSGGTNLGDLISSSDTYATGYSYNPSTNTFTISGNNGFTSLPVTIDTMSGLTITGDLTVLGSATTVSTNDLLVEDSQITINYSTGTTNSTSLGSGLLVQDGDGAGTDIQLSVGQLYLNGNINSNAEYLAATGAANRGWFTELGDILVRNTNGSSAEPDGKRVLAEDDCLDGGSY